MNPNKVKSWHILLFCIFSYVVVVLNSYANPALPGGVDTSTHLFQTWFIKKYGLANWNPYWYGGSPLLDQYPPLTHIFSAVLATFLGVAWGYKLAFAIGFLFLPVSFWYFLSEFGLSEFERKFSLLFFSFSVVFVHYFQGGVFSALISFNIVIFYFKFFKRMIDRGGYRNIAVTSLLLGFCSISHALNAAYAVLFSFIFLLIFSRGKIKEKIKEFTAVGIITAILSAWFFIPYLVNYNPANKTTGVINPMALLMALGRSFAVSVNYVGLFLLSIILFTLAYVFIANLKNKKDLGYSLFIFAFLITLAILPIMPVIGLWGVVKALFFIPLFLSIFIARGISGMRRGNIVAAFLIIPSILLFFTYTPVCVNLGGSDVPGMVSWVEKYPGDRLLFLPQNFDLITENKSHVPADEYRYSLFVIPYMTNKTLLNGWWVLAEKSMEKHGDYPLVSNLKCGRRKDYSQLLSGASWINKNTMGIRKECEPGLNNSVYCELVRDASLDLIVVNRWFPEVEEYIGGLDCTAKLKEFPHFSVYEVTGSKTFIHFSDPHVDYNYHRHLGDIHVYFYTNGSQVMDVDISESYMKHWKVYLDGREIKVKKNDYGFIRLGFNVSDVGYKEHTLVLRYTPEDFDNIFLYISAAGWILLIVSVIFDLRYLRG